MRHYPELKKPTDGSPPKAPLDDRPDARDRSVETWLSFVAMVFSMGEMLCFLAVAMISIAFASIVAQDGEVNMILPLVAVGTSLVAGMILLEFTFSRALAGHRAERRQLALRGRAGVAIFMALALCFLHPAIGLVIAVSAGLGAAAHWGLARFFAREPAWDFLKSEAVSIMAGRDGIGCRMARQRPRDHALAETIHRAVRAFGLLLSLGTASYFIAVDHMNTAAFAPVLISSLWSVEALLDYAHDRSYRSDARLLPAAEVRSGDVTGLENEQSGLVVQDLSVRNTEGVSLLSQVGFTAEPGTATGVMGDSGAGKSLLLQAMIDPFALSSLEIVGGARLNGTDLWQRHAREQSVAAALFPEDPILLPVSGAENLSCFHGGPFLDRGKWMLEQLLFSSDLVDTICAAEMATDLPYMQRKTLALARIFALGPQLYLLDRPETGLPPRQVGALLHRISQETKLGRSFVIATHDRALLDQCDRIISLQNGRIVDFGTGEDVRARLGSGWVRFIATRALVSDDSLRLWVRSQFGRTGDDGNRRKVGVVVSNMLILSCQTADPVTPGSVSFTFKHHIGYCIVRMQDNDAPLSHVQLKLAHEQAEEETPDSKLSPLALICRHCLEVELGDQLDDRWLEVKIETYDPRKTGQKPGALNADADE